MKCEKIVQELYESSLSHMSNDLMAHLQSCDACEQEYLKIQKLERTFLQADKRPVKKSNILRNLSVATAVVCLLAFQSSNDEEDFPSIEKDQIMIALHHASDETENILNLDYFDFDMSEDQEFDIEYPLDDSNEFDVYDFALSAIEDQMATDYTQL
ncbi:hypothetical protein MJH12_09285 [bacterium]|nr:hypothetical protein [bacterium]